MELLYLCVSSSNNKFKEFNFSINRRFKLKHTENDFKITEESQESYNGQKRFNIFNHFSNNFITNLTAIIGKNGSGKTSLMKDFSFIWKDNENSNGSLRYALIFEQEKNTYTLTSNMKVKANFSKLQKSELPFLIRIDNTFNSCEYYHDINTLEGGYDGSLMNIIARDYRDYTENLHTTGFHIDPIDAHAAMETQRQMELVTSGSVLLPFDIKSFSVGVVPISYSTSMMPFDIAKDTDNHNYADKISKMLTEAHSKINKIHVKTNSRLIQFILSGMFFSIANFVALKRIVPEEQKEEILQIVSSLVSFKTGERLSLRECRELYRCWLKHTEALDQNNQNRREAFDKVWDFLIKDNVSAFRPFKDRFYSKEIDLNAIKNFYQNYKITTFDVTNYFQFSWGLSSGEMAYLAFFSRIYAIKNYLQNQIKVTSGCIPYKDYLFVIDEADVYLHPEWQREYIQKLINFLTKFFQESLFRSGSYVPKIQLIIATHSPIILSDIPQQHILLLENNKTTSPNNKTFAANIFNLYNNNYIFEKGFFGAIMGRFSEKVLSNIVKFVQIVDETFLFEAMVRRNITESVEYIDNYSIMDKLYIDKKEDYVKSIHLSIFHYNSSLKKLISFCKVNFKNQFLKYPNNRFVFISTKNTNKETDYINEEYTLKVLDNNHHLLREAIDRNSEKIYEILNLVGEKIFADILRNKFERLKLKAEKR